MSLIGLVAGWQRALSQNDWNPFFLNKREKDENKNSM